VLIISEARRIDVDVCLSQTDAVAALQPNGTMGQDYGSGPGLMRRSKRHHCCT